MYYVYVIYNSLADKFYVGQTGNLDARLRYHNDKVGNHYTAKLKGEWELVYSEPTPTRSEALRRERQLKSAKGREYIKQFIDNPG
jgi:putative endonuclease